MQSADKLSILFVSHKYPPATGGMEKQSFELINRMHAHSIVHTLVFDGSESIIQFFLKLNRRILAILKRHPEIGIIHYNDGLIASLSLYHKGYAHLLKMVTVHGLDVVFPWKYFQRKVLPRFNRFDHIIAVSQATADAIISRGVDAHRVTVIANGVDHQWAVDIAAYSNSVEYNDKEWLSSPIDNVVKLHPTLPTNKDLLILLGRPVKRKGFSWFIKNVLPLLDDRYHILLVGPFSWKADRQEKLLRRLPARWQSLVALFLGFPSDRNRIRQLLAQPNVAARATHLGKLPDTDLRHLLGKATAFLMPNVPVPGDMEGFGLVCLEASSRGAIVFASALEGITDAIHHHNNGFLLPTANKLAWAKALNDFLDKSAEHRAGLSSTFQQYTLQHFGWDKMTQAYQQLFFRMHQEKLKKSS